MDYINKKLENIKTKGKGCIPDYYRLQGYCTAKGYKFIACSGCTNLPNRLTGIIIKKDEQQVASISCEINFLSPIHSTKEGK